MFITQTINTDPENIELLKKSKDKLEKFGYEVEIISETSFAFKKIPLMLAGKSHEEIAEDLFASPDISAGLSEEKILVTTACKAAVKAGEKLSIWQAEELIKRWKSTVHPEVCPHGRPISKVIPKNEIAKFFNRPE